MQPEDIHQPAWSAIHSSYLGRPSDTENGGEKRSRVPCTREPFKLENFTYLQYTITHKSFRESTKCMGEMFIRNKSTIRQFLISKTTDKTYNSSKHFTSSDSLVPESHSIHRVLSKVTFWCTRVAGIQCCPPGAKTACKIIPIVALVESHSFLLLGGIWQPGARVSSQPSRWSSSLQHISSLLKQETEKKTI